MTEPTRRHRTIPEQIEESSKIKIEVKDRFSKEELVSTGSTLLDLACSDTPYGGFRLGRMVNLIGDSSSGKTLICLSTLAEICQHKRFDNYRIIFDDVEAAMSFDIAKLFGKKLEERIEPPAYDKNGEPMPSDTIQQFQYNIINALNDESPFIYILDSFDALSSDEEAKKLDEAMAAYEKGNAPKGTYAMEKAKIGGRALSMVTRKLQKTNSILIIISQTRDNIDPMSFQKKTRSGGKALKFYATHEIWVACGKKIQKKERIIGVDAVLKIEKNKLTGKRREIKFPIFYDYGIDDIGSCIDFLIDEGYWKKQKLTILADDLSITGTREKIISQIEDSNYERRLKRIIGDCWMNIEESLKLNRKSKYK